MGPKYDVSLSQIFHSKNTLKYKMYCQNCKTRFSEKVCLVSLEKSRLLIRLMDFLVRSQTRLHLNQSSIASVQDIFSLALLSSKQSINGWLMKLDFLWMNPMNLQINQALLKHLGIYIFPQINP